MSYRIEFSFAAWRVPAPECGTAEDQFVVATLGGDNNVISSGGAVARKWSAVCIGTRQDVIRQACRLAKSCEGGGLQMPGRKSITPEAYIAKFRKLMDEAPHIADGYKGEWFSKSFKICEPKERVEAMRETHPDVLKALYSFREPTPTRNWFTETDMLEWEFSIEPDQMKQFFSVLPTILGEGFAWDLCKIRGPGEK